MKNVRRLRQRIFVASQKNDLKRVRSLQKLMLRSRSNILMSVRRVTQVNDGKNTPGVDKLTVKTPKARGAMVDRLSTNTPWKARPGRRVYIPKSNGKTRPLGIPVMEDRARQAIVKNALEPFWEARFEGTSYGFRPGRSTHDAIEKIFGFARPNQTMKWVVDADIKGAFDNIAHDHLLETIGPVPGRELIKQWLKAGYVEEEVWHSTESGTPQGGVISPLLANIALHGMEKLLGIRYLPGDTSRRSKASNPRAVIRYADDFVVFCQSREDAEKVIMELKGWLALRGLQLSEEKTRIVHLTEGFDFLGFTVKNYKVDNTKTGYKLLITPSKEKVNELQERLRTEWLGLSGHSINRVLQRLNPIIRGWANYFRYGVSSKTFKDLDFFMWNREKRWGKRAHPHKPVKWRNARYWGRLNLRRQDRWVFGNTRTGVYLNKFIWFPVERHILVKGQNSADDPVLQDYWKKRKLDRCKDLRLSDRKIVVRQKGVCPVCGDSLFNGELTGLIAPGGEEIQRHHKKPKSEGGPDTYRNLQFQHLFCHQKTHAQKGVNENRRPTNEEMVAEERAKLRSLLALDDDFKW